MIGDQIAQLKVIASKLKDLLPDASPAPWRIYRCSNNDDMTRNACGVSCASDPPDEHPSVISTGDDYCGSCCHCLTTVNAELIVWLRNAAPGIQALCEQLSKEPACVFGADGRVVTMQGPQLPPPPPPMTDEELFDAIDGLYAYDCGATDSGIHDEKLRSRVKRELARDVEHLSFCRMKGIHTPERLAVYVRNMLAPDSGYGLEDVAEFIKWLSEHMDIDL